MLDLLRPYQDFGQQKLLVEVGHADAAFAGDRDTVRPRQTALGRLVGQAMMARTRADLAVINSGGVRDSLPAGQLTYKDLLKVQPFGNTLVTVELSGAELMAYLSAVLKMSPGSGAFAQFAGITLVIEQNTVREARIQGAPIDPAKTYRMAINNFVAAGGDGYPKLTQHKSLVDSGFVDADALRAYISANSPLKVADFAPERMIQRR